MIERVVRNDEVVGLIPIWSTTYFRTKIPVQVVEHNGLSQWREIMQTRLVHWPPIC